jgi:hypothetical protein
VNRLNTLPGRWGAGRPASLRHLSLLPSRHKRKLKAIVAGSAGEQGCGGLGRERGRERARGPFPSLPLPNLLPAGNRGFIDIMDMPNTNKYSFDG